MSITRLPSGRYRAQVYHQGRNLSVPKILGLHQSSFATKREAKLAREQARQQLTQTHSSVTVQQWWRTWTTDPLYQRPKASTNRHNAERTRAFCTEHAGLPLTAVDDLTVARWIAGGRNRGTVPALRAMFNDAASAKAGRLITTNPFANLRLPQSRGNADKQPPSEQLVAELIRHAEHLAHPAFAAWLEVACFTGLRPGELDALQWTDLDPHAKRIRVDRQWNGREFTTPKTGPRIAPLTDPARRALDRLPRETEWCFTTIRGTHFTASARAYHWKAVRAAAGWDGSLYLATRHFAGWWMVNVLDMSSEDVAIALGHRDGGALVRRLYGHRDHDRALTRVVDAASQAGRVEPLRIVRKDTA